MPLHPMRLPLMPTREEVAVITVTSAGVSAVPRRVKDVRTTLPMEMAMETEKVEKEESRAARSLQRLKAKERGGSASMVGSDYRIGCPTNA